MDKCKFMTITIIQIEAFKLVPSTDYTNASDTYSFSSLWQDENGSYRQLIVADKKQLSPGQLHQFNVVFISESKQKIEFEMTRILVLMGIASARKPGGKKFSSLKVKQKKNTIR